ncbi:MAG: hypothetical protein EOS54_28365 [Mesorhizobium sp.]|uniref:hypothetical protein n=3 Tax=Mesorhizobium TaxID=68287 RepID=UPI000F762C67|nr:MULTISPECIES: hypothetical protein [unclassified Mesorhizobium]AZO51395.1 hypothetical protein EJ073_29425 [Mesorhizobium sp. M4B.F.Ca.ET.058.02.1.1]RVC45352.1 hypothetical protein EN781_10265 [Mesorhizobium sp. M4A.F.Ca.ET.090.04.2.1]RWC12052.1 MAG: hypothetical protein EOS53_26320 [Mesorhizobium sp.]RWC38090.1 MAG: hypothetical protein EOS54_28365 [Mesorhizobium sp.]RWD12560.1 MAG: hypothetical protein EOS74_22060 [Mesorhizobium sp.]
MLDKTEQQVEKDKCLVFEKTMRATIQPYWHLVERRESDLLKKYITVVQFQTYGTVSSFVASALGKACLDGRVFCSPGEPTVDAAFSALKSDYYCYLKNRDVKSENLRNCLKEEKIRKSQLAKYWANLPKGKTDWCIGNAFGRNFPPFQVLSSCVADDIGIQCFKHARQCRAG